MKDSKKKATRAKSTGKRTSHIKKKKFKVKYGKIAVLFLLMVIVYFGVVLLYRVPIKNIIIKGNVYLTDQEIIDLAGLRNYPSILKTPNSKIKKKLEKHTYIKSVKVKKKNCFSRVVIEVEENRPMFYYQPEQKTILENGTKVDDVFAVPTVINQMPDIVYGKFLTKMANVPDEVMVKISEVRYAPSEVDEELFFMTMSDGNYVYITLYRFEKIHNYLEYVENFNNRKGIIHLDSGDYLEVLEGE